MSGYQSLLELVNKLLKFDKRVAAGEKVKAYINFKKSLGEIDNDLFNAYFLYINNVLIIEYSFDEALTMLNELEKLIAKKEESFGLVLNQIKELKRAANQIKELSNSIVEFSDFDRADLKAIIDLFTMHLFKVETLNENRTLGISTILINSIEDAIRFAREQDLPDDYQDWASLRSISAGKRFDYEAQTKLKVNDLYDYIISSDYDEIIFNSLSDKLKILFDDVYGDFLNLIIFNAYRIKDDTNIFTVILKAYEKGYWPCGWKGEYPEGSLLIYDRS